MSTLKTVNVQIGQSGTASNNFTWYQPASPDGTVRLGQGNSGATTSDILVASASGLFIGGSTVPASRIVQGTAQTTNGAATYSYTGIPSWAKKITMTYAGVTGSTSTIRRILVGTSSGYATSGYYVTESAMTSGTTNDTLQTGAFIPISGAVPDAHSGIAQLVLVDSSTNKWAISAATQRDAFNYYTWITAGYVALSGTLDRIQIMVASGTLAGGTVNIIYEG